MGLRLNVEIWPNVINCSIQSTFVGFLSGQFGVKGRSCSEEMCHRNIRRFPILLVVLFQNLVWMPLIPVFQQNFQLWRDEERQKCERLQGHYYLISLTNSYLKLTTDHKNTKYSNKHFLYKYWYGKIMFSNMAQNQRTWLKNGLTLPPSQNHTIVQVHMYLREVLKKITLKRA